MIGGCGSVTPPPIGCLLVVSETCEPVNNNKKLKWAFFMLSFHTTILAHFLNISILDTLFLYYNSHTHTSVSISYISFLYYNPHTPYL